MWEDERYGGSILTLYYVVWKTDQIFLLRVWFLAWNSLLSFPFKAGRSAEV